MSESTESAGDGLAARAAAARLLEAALARRNGLEEAAGTAEFRSLSARDRGFARALVLTTLRRLRAIDAALDAKLKSPPPEAVRNILRLGAAQLWRMEVPAWAAVNTAVALAGGRRETERFKSLVNAVLRGVGREGEPEVETYAPDWLHQRWRAAYGEAAALAIGAVIPEEPPTDLTLKGEPPEGLDGRLLPNGSFRTALRGDVAGWPGYEQGGWWVQDAAAALPARLLGVTADETVLDLCAAPGGKTMQLAAAGGRVTAVDRAQARLRRLNENLRRTGLQAETVAADATVWDDDRTFDAVLLDAPCSATGTFRRHPDVLWAARPGDVAPLAALQSRLLDAAARRVRPGGRLVYCTCTLEPEEGEAQLAAFLARSPEFARSPIAMGEAGSPDEARTPDGDLRILPSLWADRGGLDGFFVSRLVREG